jgi:hypothetical protein
MAIVSHQPPSPRKSDVGMERRPEAINPNPIINNIFNKRKRESIILN